MSHDHHGHAGHQQGAGDDGLNGALLSGLDGFMESLKENFTEAANQVMDAATGGGSHDHAGHHDHHNHGAAATNSEAHDHSNHGAHAHGTGDHGGHHLMKMWFHGGYEEVILFDFWRTETFIGMLLSCAVIFIMGAAYEGIKWFRVYLQMSQTAACKIPKERGIRSAEMAADSVPLSCPEKRGSQEEIYNPTVTPPQRTKVQRNSPFADTTAMSTARFVQALLYVVQLVLAYWLMLIVMTYNTYLTLAVIGGAGFGHWLFAVLKLRSAHGDTADSFATDACH